MRILKGLEFTGSIHLTGAMKKIFLCIIIAFTALLPNCTNTNGKEIPNASKGILDLSQWDFTQDGSIMLNGEWSFSWMHFLNPDSNGITLSGNTSFIYVPSLWNGKEFNGHKTGPTGFATYSLQIIMPPHSAGSDFSFSIPSQGTALEFFVNGKKIFNAGVPGKSKDESKPMYNPAVVTYPVSTNILNIVAHVSNYDYSKGGLWLQISFGKKEAITRSFYLDAIVNIFLLGSLFIIGVYHIGLFILRRKDRSTIYFAIFCFLIMLRILSTGICLIRFFIPMISFSLLIQIEYLSFMLSIPIFLMFFHSISDSFVHRHVSLLSIFISGIFSIIVIFTTPAIFTSTIIFFEFFTLLLGIYAILMLVASTIKGIEYAFTFLCGMAIILIFLIHDILVANQSISATYLFPVGLFIFILLQSYILSTRFSRTISKVELLSAHLEVYSISLEKKVNEKIKALGLSEEKYRTILEAMMEGFFEISDEGRFIFINDAICEILRRPREEIIGLHYAHLTNIKNCENKHMSCVKNPTSICDSDLLNLEIKRPDGEVRDITVSLVPNNYSSGIRGLARDCTELKKAELARFDLDRQKSLFFTNISHEIRTPLTLILSPLESYLQGDYTIDINHAFFESIYRNALRLLKLINNLLDFSKLEAGRMTMCISEIDIVKFMKNYISSIQSACESKKITIVFTAVDTNSRLMGDPEKIDKIVMNLLSNAIKYTEPGGVITIRIRENKKYFLIDFQDTGPGIPENFIDIIFDRFGQATTAASNKHIGTGIGLALARELTEMHSGSISVQSRYSEKYPDDHGSLFTVTLKKGKKHFLKRPEVVFSESGFHAGTISGHRYYGMREMNDLPTNQMSNIENKTDTAVKNNPANKSLILIVDDNNDMREYVAALLQPHYAVITAQNGFEGLKNVEKFLPDLVITDVMMPGMDGYEMTRRIRETKSTIKSIPIIMLTAKADLSLKIEGIESGADDYLVKPFNAKEILTRIHSLLKTREYEKLISRRNSEIEEELEVARLIQERLLPAHLTCPPGYTCHAVYIPMDKVGGDFYDFACYEHFIDLFIADVSGHGLSGAFLAMITHMAFENETERRSPGITLQKLNAIIHHLTVKNNFVTTFYCTIDTDTNLLRYANAGHFPPFLYRRETGCFFDLEAKGLPLGWFSDIKVEEKTIQLSKGDRLILYTDGITECADQEGTLWGEERFKKMIADTITLSPQDFTKKLIEELNVFSQSETFNDDLTLVVFDIN